MKTAFRVLSLDGGGSKGVYTLGVLKQVEAILGSPLHKRFDLIYGTSTGAIIGTLISVCGMTVEQIQSEYFKLIPDIMGKTYAASRSAALIKHTDRLLNGRTITDAKTLLGIVAVRCDFCRPLIFKSSINMAYALKSSFLPWFGAPLHEAVVASCSAYPFFRKSVVHIKQDGRVMPVEAMDGGFVANNPTLFALTDALSALKHDPVSVRVLSVGTGGFSQPEPTLLKRLAKRVVRPIFDIKLMESTLEANSNSMELLRSLLLGKVRCERINGQFPNKKYATTFLEANQAKLDLLYRLGRKSVENTETEKRIRDLLA